MMMFVPINVFQVPLIENELGLSDYYLSVICVTISIAMAVGALIYPSIRKEISNIMLFKMAGFGMAVSYLILYLTQYFGVYGKTVGLIASMLLLGIGIAHISIMMQTLFFDVVEESYIPRMGAVSAMAAYCVTPIFSMVFGALSAYISVLNIFLICAVCAMILFSVTGSFLLVKNEESFS